MCSYDTFILLYAEIKSGQDERQVWSVRRQSRKDSTGHVGVHVSVVRGERQTHGIYLQAKEMKTQACVLLAHLEEFFMGPLQLMHVQVPSDRRNKNLLVNAF